MGLSTKYCKTRMEYANDSILDYIFKEYQVSGGLIVRKAKPFHQWMRSDLQLASLYQAGVRLKSTEY